MPKLQFALPISICNPVSELSLSNFMLEMHIIYCMYSFLVTFVIIFFATTAFWDDCLADTKLHGLTIIYIQEFSICRIYCCCAEYTVQ